MDKLIQLWNLFGKGRPPAPEKAKSDPIRPPDYFKEPIDDNINNVFINKNSKSDRQKKISDN
uniref:Uncharacterized protein n=1 Tax=Abalone asfa-like virus TaxID=2839893 RepID=A0A5K7Y3G2_9VIRU|nr:hypothetical protein [Abalone asfa-like virus]